MFGNKRALENTVDEILHTHYETVIKLEERDKVLADRLQEVLAEEQRLKEVRTGIVVEANRGAKARRFFNQLFEEMDKE